MLVVDWVFRDELVLVFRVFPSAMMAASSSSTKPLGPYLIIFLVVDWSRAYLYDGCIQLSNLLVIVLLLLLLLLARLILPYNPVYIPIFVLLVLGPELQDIVFMALC